MPRAAPRALRVLRRATFSSVGDAHATPRVVARAAAGGAGGSSGEQAATSANFPYAALAGTLGLAAGALALAQAPGAGGVEAAAKAAPPAEPSKGSSEAGSGFERRSRPTTLPIVGFDKEGNKLFSHPRRPDLPTISLERFQGDHDGRVWVAMQGGVYDVTPFLDAHPGGSGRIEMVDGRDLARFWEVYRLHDRPHVRGLLEEYRIGNLSKEDYEKVRGDTQFSSYYGDDPKRPAAEKGELRIASAAPWNSEPANLARLTESFFTPNDLFFVRNHNNVPNIKAEDYTLEIEENDAIGVKPTTFTLEDLKTKFERVEVISALQCAGNRQEDYVTDERPLYVAPHWRNGAIGCAKWAGVRVRDVLKAAGMDVDSISLGKKTTNGMRIVNFIADDTDETGTPYAGVIPIEKALDPFGDAILAYEMNEETLPRDHGYPIRLVAPGHAGCRNVKWVRNIAVTAAASELDSGSRLDRHFAPDISWDAHRDHVALVRCPEHDVGCDVSKVREDQGPVIQTGPVQSIITVPGNHSRISSRDGQHVTVKGVAWSGAGRGIVRVEISVDGGATWCSAELDKGPLHQDIMSGRTPAPENAMGRNWAWCQFSKDVELTPDQRLALRRGQQVQLEVLCKAVDGDFNTQPERMRDSWNVLGICVNHWCRVNVMLDPTLAPTAEPPRPRAPEPGAHIDAWGNSWALETADDVE